MTDIIITLNDLVARHGLQQIEERLHNLRPAFASMGEYMMRRAEDNFKGEHDPDGVAWAPLSAAYRKRKRGTRILTESGRLRASITYRADGTQVVAGCNPVYARAQQYGYQRRNLPARPFLGASEGDKQELGEILLDYLNL
ncbi:MAG: phage virion morphogenesis protein [Cyanomargarita calcarea GSE-NOS-MK-12-04C]|jgi:phage virion morphogenesis protein|uniref:Phage virion morphogenesis protein n=1 Tax=Cyanomargarita calcarea GSE-NOS-MK-12-04C TaxID=2839659 RepID=A0A951UT79_9CYAN|nr:phage virion morphogenesis protein [Cyanomargarita calcarea GSE-NOS-MK-12-04C]